MKKVLEPKTYQTVEKFEDNERTFVSRHVGPSAAEMADMLKEVEVESLSELIEQTIPKSILLEDDSQFTTLAEKPAWSERLAISELKRIMSRNEVWRSYIGQGYYGTIVPPVILRNFFENPGWYTSYTPYQAEISQGRLEALINFQTLICELMGMDIANASLLDEATAAAEAMILMRRVSKNSKARKLFVSEEIFLQTQAVLTTRAEPVDIEVVVGKVEDFVANTAAGDESEFFGAILTYQGSEGTLLDLKAPITALQAKGIRVTVMTDLLAALIVEPAGNLGADITCGSSQRLGVPMGFGGPHAAFFAVKTELKRFLPGRVIGLSKDANGNPSYRMALQTREQHIRKEKATSNICTAQALLANMSAMYAIYHGKDGLTQIANRIHVFTRALHDKLGEAIAHDNGIVVNEYFFDTLTVALTKTGLANLQKAAALKRINLRYGTVAELGKRVGENIRGKGSEYSHFAAVSLDETVTPADLTDLQAVFLSALSSDLKEQSDVLLDSDMAIDEKTKVPAGPGIPQSLHRSDAPLKHPIFKMIHSETQMLRYLATLEKKDVSLNFSMIPLGSCTMKLNAVSEMLPLSWDEVSTIHPMVPAEQSLGYAEIVKSLEQDLQELTGFAAVSLQPNSGAQGEYAGLLAIRSYHLSLGEANRDVVLIPVSAHGTNPASTIMAGMKPVLVSCLDNGNIDLDDFMKKCEQHSETLAALMITYPSTHGVFEEDVLLMTKKVHDCGGQVYMDGANMNAQAGFTCPERIGADVCHLNLHKTFAIPHGGGGPGMGPIGVREHLKPFLPSHPFIPIQEQQQDAAKLGTGDVHLTGPISAAPYGSASILLISYLYIKMLSLTGLKQVTAIAILNANYLRKKLEAHFPILYTGENGFVAHEMIIDVRNFSKTADVSAEDIAKRLIDYGFHAPTMSWPVVGTLMIEPTESEDKGELDRFAEALIQIRQEISKIEAGTWPRDNNPLKNAPHTSQVICADLWNFPYTREEAVFPLPWLKVKKYWPPVSRIDNVHGDRNLFCVCPPIEEYSSMG